MGGRLPEKERNAMKTCYQCGGLVIRKSIDLDMDGISIRDIDVDVCQKCGEKYFDTKTATFVQEVTAFIKIKRAELPTAE